MSEIGALRVGAACAVFAACALVACGSEGEAGPSPVAPALGARAGFDGPPPRHVLVITTDTLRADRLGCYGNSANTSPAIDRLASQGARFENAVVPRGQTWPALTTMLTGKSPITHGVRKNGVMPRYEHAMLPQFLRDAGYATGAFLANYHEAIADPARRGLDALVVGPQKGDRDQASWDRRVTTAALEWIEANAERKTFTWLHLMNPHRPYLPSAEMAGFVPDYDGWLGDEVTLTALRTATRTGAVALEEARLDHLLQRPRPRARAQTYERLIQAQDGALTFDQVLDLIVLGDVVLQDADLDYILGRYDAEVRASDEHVGEVLSALQRLDLEEDTLVIFTADHGEELYDHNNYFFHASSIYEGVVGVPLIVRWPGRIGPRTTPAVVEFADLFPTILRSVGLPVPTDAQGQSLWPLLLGRDSGDRVAVTEVFHQREDDAPPPFDAVYAARNRRWKFVMNRSGAHPRYLPYMSLERGGFAIGFEELYDLEHDPREQTNLLALDAATARKRRTGPSRTGDEELALYLASAYRARLHLAQELESWLEQHASSASQSDDGSGLTDELRDSLASLGYVDAAPELGAAGEDADAPRRGLAATVLELASDAVESMESLLLMAEAQVWLGDVEAARGHAARAEEMADADSRPRLIQRLQAVGLR